MPHPRSPLSMSSTNPPIAAIHVVWRQTPVSQDRLSGDARPGVGYKALSAAAAADAADDQGGVVIHATT